MPQPPPVLQCPPLPGQTHCVEDGAQEVVPCPKGTHRGGAPWLSPECYGLYGQMDPEGTHSANPLRGGGGVGGGRFREATWT